ncbi:MAG: radical SAM protein [Patescibacteria group bacterium]
MKIQLINAPTDPGIGGGGNTGCFPHLGILSIATALIKKFPDFEIECIDGSVTAIDEIIAEVDADIVGISALTMTYESTLAIAREAKKKGAFVVVGNDHPSRLANMIIQNRPEIDVVVRGDYGEVPMTQLVKARMLGQDFDKISCLTFRDKGEVKQTPAQEWSLNDLPIPDRSFIKDFEPYIKNYMATYARWHTGEKIIPMSINLARGCGYGERSRCLFCDILDLKRRAVSSERAWQEIRILVEKFGVNFLYEVCDSLSSFYQPIKGEDQGFLSRFVDSRPDDLFPQWLVYARADEIVRDYNLIELFSKLGVRRVNIGLESGDNQMLISIRKGYKVETNIRAIEILREANMEAHCSFVLGAIGESEQSLENTVSLCQQILEIGHIVVCDPSPLLPLPGAPAWKVMMNPTVAKKQCNRFGIDYSLSLAETFRKKFGGTDLLDTGELSREWIKAFTLVTPEIIKNFCEEIRMLSWKHEVFSGQSVGIRGIGMRS